MVSEISLEVLVKKDVQKSTHLPAEIASHEPRTKAYFIRLLRENPKIRWPRRLDEHLDYTKWEYSEEYKSALRSYDAARLDLGLVTVAQLNQENGCVPQSFTPRIVSFNLRHA
jgi:hypothetical protein